MKKTCTLLLLSALMLTACGQNTQTAQTAAVTSETTASGTTTSETTADTTAAETAAESAETAAEETTAAQNDNVASGDETIAAEDIVDDGMEPIPLSKVAQGSYEVNVRSSSSMFKVAKAKLNVSDEPTLELYIASSSYEYMFNGTAEEAASAGESSYIRPVTDDEGMNVYSFPAEYLDGEIKIAAFSKKKQKWYDRSILIESASLPSDTIEGYASSLEETGLTDGEYLIDVTLEGGSGRASVESPAHLTVSDGQATAIVVWSSDKYDYMMVNGEKYLPLEGYDTSAFEIPVTAFDGRMNVSADTTAMSTPHEIEYTLYFDSSTAKAAE